MPEQKEQSTIYTYLDRITGADGIKTTNKIQVAIDINTAVTIVGIGLGLVVFSHLLGAGIRALERNSVR